MKQTYRITRDAIKEWWRDLSKKGHKIVILFALGLLLGFVAFTVSIYYTAQSRVMYRQKIENNESRIDELEKKNGK